jgi:N-acetylneuraminic acid mutarotase
MYNAISSGLPQFKRIVLLIFGFIVCLVSYTGIRAITATSSLRIAASPTGNIVTGSFVQTGDNAIRASNPARTLSLAERVAYQRAIEDVYWRHRIWPKERPDSKPSLDAVMSEAQLKKKVTDYLRRSQLLADYWHRPLAAEQLQAEMDRMTQHTKQPEVLRELFAALGNDPFVIAECLARPALAERLLTNWYAYDQTIHGDVKHRAEAQLRMHDGVEQMKQLSGTYTETELVRSANSHDKVNPGARHDVELDGYEWDETIQKLSGTFGVRSRQRGIAALQNGDMPVHSKDADTDYDSLPVGKLSSLQEDETSYYATAILSKTADRLKLATVAWLKEPLAPWLARAGNQLNTATTVPNGNYMLPQNSSSVGDCTENTWTATSGPPDGRVGHTAVWTGSEMIVWGGVGSSSFTYSNTGGRYDPSTDNWTSTATTNAPGGRYGHTAVWTGTEMIVWGGIAGTGTVRSGARYNPSTNSWTATSLTNAPSARSGHTAVCSGNEMIVWGGDFFDTTTHYLNTGGRYNPVSNSWTATSLINAPSARSVHTAVWTGNQMIVWGGVSNGVGVDTGGRYNPGTNSWIATTTANAPDPREYHTAVWTGTAMIIWGGDNGGVPFRTGGKYFPATDTWLATTVTNAPLARSGYTAVWTGQEMIIWGGFGGGNYLRTGAKYNPGANSWTATGTTNAPTGRSGHTAVWSGTEMIIWGGQTPGNTNTGGRYNPNSNSWTPISNTPTPRRYHAAVWTGTEMIIWGGIVPFSIDPAFYTNTGGKYDPSTDNWTATNTIRAPTGRELPTAVWTGDEMIIWGGYSYDGTDHYWNTGGRYNPNTDSWLPTSITNAPDGREGHTAVWTGVEMIVWGGYFYDGTYLNTGGKYNPGTNRWTAISSTNAPTARGSHGAVWTGTQMIVWGGAGASGYLNTGGRYNANTDIWTATSTVNAPSPRTVYSPLWTGSEMIVWGGFAYDAMANEVYFNTGGRYNPNTNSWTATATANAPDGRSSHTAVWTGSEMIVWGGHGDFDLLGYYFNTGGRYDPRTGSWTPTSTVEAPDGRYRHTAVWTGNEMIVWGGILYSNSSTNTGGRYCAPFDGSQLGNISTRAFVQTGDNVVIGGFIVQGAQTKRVIIRAIGPELGAPPYNIPNALANPTLELHDGTGALIASNDNWRTTIIGGIIISNQVRDITNSGYAPGDGRESAIIADLAPGNYTAIVRGVNNTTGVGLVEVYDLSGGASSILSNISTRSFVQTDDNVMIGGFIVQGAQPKRVIIRAIGPDLTQYGVPDPLADPTLELHNGTGALIASNDNWQHTIIGGIITSDQVRDIRNSGYAPGDPNDSAIIAELPPGNYTAIVRGVNNTTGVGLVEVYDLQ